MAKPAPIVKATPEALRDWQLLRRSGHASGALQKRCSALIPKPGTEPAKIRVKVGKDGGTLYDRNSKWAATFEKSYDDAGRRTWIVISVEATRR